MFPSTADTNRARPLAFCAHQNNALPSVAQAHGPTRPSNSTAPGYGTKGVSALPEVYKISVVALPKAQIRTLTTARPVQLSDVSERAEKTKASQELPSSRALNQT